MSAASKAERLRALALALLTHGRGLTRKAGSFLGQLVADPSELTDKQADWLATLAERAGMSEQMEDFSNA